MNLVRYSGRPTHFPHPGGLERASPPTRGALSFAFSVGQADFHLVSSPVLRFGSVPLGRSLLARRGPSRERLRPIEQGWVICGVA